MSKSPRLRTGASGDLVSCVFANDRLDWRPCIPPSYPHSRGLARARAAWRRGVGIVGRNEAAPMGATRALTADSDSPPCAAQCFGQRWLDVVSGDYLRRPQFLRDLCRLEDCHENVGRFTFGRVYGQDHAANFVTHGARPVFDCNCPFSRHVPLPSRREVTWRCEDQQFGLNAHSVGPNVVLSLVCLQLRSNRNARRQIGELRWLMIKASASGSAIRGWLQSDKVHCHRNSLLRRLTFMPPKLCARIDRLTQSARINR